MKQYQKLLCLVTAMLLALPGFMGCGAAETETTAAAAADTAPETETAVETTRAETKDNLPEIDLGGITVPILYRGCPADVIEIYAEELTGEPVSDAIYNRNLSVCERLNIQFDFSYIFSNTHNFSSFCVSIEKQATKKLRRLFFMPLALQPSAAESGPVWIWHACRSFAVYRLLQELQQGRHIR